jgi:hypothetical protein
MGKETSRQPSFSPPPEILASGHFLRIANVQDINKMTNDFDFAYTACIAMKKLQAEVKKKREIKPSIGVQPNFESPVEELKQHTPNAIRAKLPNRTTLMCDRHRDI